MVAAYRSYDEMCADIGRCIAELRQAKGWKQPKLAEEAGVDLKRLQALEQGVASPSARILYKIAKALGVDPIDFFHPPRSRIVPFGRPPKTP